MVLFWPIQQELDCINTAGDILGKIKFNGLTNKHSFHLECDAIKLTDIEAASIKQRLADLDSGKLHIPMQDDD